MTADPKVTKFMDEEERALIKAVESDDCVPSCSGVSAKRKRELQQVAGTTMRDERLQR